MLKAGIVRRLMLAAGMSIAVLSPAALGKNILLGTPNYSDAEFKQGGYVTDPVNVDSNGASAFPKELNTYSWQNQYFYLNVSGTDLDQLLVITLQPAWNNGTGLLWVALDHWNGIAWVEVGQTEVNASTPGDLIVRSKELLSGRNDFRLRALGGSGGTQVVTWDQITLISRSKDDTKTILYGTNNGSDADFQPSGYVLRSIDLDLEPSTAFPKEINDSWWQITYFKTWFNAQQAATGLNITLDPAWNDGSGGLSIALDRWSPSAWNWVQVGAASVNAATPGLIAIAGSQLACGDNYFRLRYVSGSGNTHVVTWDQIRFETPDVDPSYFTPAGNNNNSDTDFKQAPYSSTPVQISNHGAFTVATNFPKEINDSWWQTQYFYLTLNNQQITRALDIVMDVCWSDGTGTLAVAVDLWKPSVANWVQVAAVNARGGTMPTAVIAATNLLAGRNDFRFRSLGGVGGTHVATWDALRFQSHLGTSTLTRALFPSNRVGATVAVGNVATNTGTELVLASEAGMTGTVKILSRTGATLRSFVPFTGYTQGLNVAVGNVSGDALAEILVAPRAANPYSAIKVYNGHGTLLRTLSVTNGNYGLSMAVGDVDGNGLQEIVVNNNRRKILVLTGEGADTWLGFDLNPEIAREEVYMPFYDNFISSVHVGTADVNGDGLDEIVVPVCRRMIIPPATGEGSYQVIRVYSAGGALYDLFYVGGFFKGYAGSLDTLRPSLAVAGADFNGDGRDELAVGFDRVSTPGNEVKIFQSSGLLLGALPVYSHIVPNNLNLAAGDVDDDGVPEILLAPSGVTTEEKALVLETR